GPFVEYAVAARLLAGCDAFALDAGVSGERLATVAVRPAPAGATTWPLVPAGAVADVVVGVVGDDLVCIEDEPPGVPPRNHAAMPIADRAAQSPSRTVLATGVD